jgi:hypothetical protein
LPQLSHKNNFICFFGIVIILMHLAYSSQHSVYYRYFLGKWFGAGVGMQGIGGGHPPRRAIGETGRNGAPCPLQKP